MLRSARSHSTGLGATTFALLLAASACVVKPIQLGPDGSQDPGSATDATGTGGAGAPDGAPADVHVWDGPPVGSSVVSCPVAGSNLVFAFDSLNAEWVRSLRWRDSTGALSGDLNAYGGAPGCTTVFEFFGQAFAAPENTTPYVIGTNTLSSITGCGTADPTITTRSPDCTGAPQIPVTTVYHFYDGAKADEVRVTRTIGFDARTGVTKGVGMRVFVPRVRRDTYANVLIPNAAGTAVTTASVNACERDCFTPTGASWNGKWFADADPTSGLAMIVVRDPTMTTAVSLAVNNDGASASNLSSFVVLQPAGGWAAPLTEVEYLCFADRTSWPEAARAAATLPAFCGP
jgi:hypothetical protein